ncbi:X8 domain containing protein, partial [Trema orientale]
MAKHKQLIMGSKLTITNLPNLIFYCYIIPTLTPSSTTTTTTSPASSGVSWCVSSQSASQIALQVALDYACGYGGAYCSAIQPSGSCYNLNNIRDHASYAFNSYYQKNPIPNSCNFGGTVVITSTNP